MYKIGDKVKLKGIKSVEASWDEVKNHYPYMVGYVKFIYDNNYLVIYNSNRTEAWAFSPNDIEPFENKCCHCICEEKIRKDERAKVIEEIISKIKKR